MSVHEQFAEDLALHAMGVLGPDERIALESHLAGCDDCRRELGLLRGDTAMLAYSVLGSTPPQRSRQRLVDAVRQESRKRVTSSRRAWWAPLPWIAAATMALLAIFLMRQNASLQQELSSLNERSKIEGDELERAHRIVATLTATDALRVTLVEAKSAPQPQGKAIYVSDRGSLIFIASNFRKLPADKAYELWLVPAKGDPIAAGVFKPDSRGSATVVNPPLPPGIQAKAFAITVEPEGGSPKATSPIVMLGAGE